MQSAAAKRRRRTAAKLLCRHPGRSLARGQVAAVMDFFIDDPKRLHFFLHDAIEHDLGRIGQGAPPMVRATDRQPSTLSSPGTRISRSRDEVGVPSGSTPDDSIRQPSGVAVQSPVPYPPEASNDHERICPAFGSQPMICLPEETAMPSLTDGVVAFQEALVGDPADRGADGLAVALGPPGSHQPAEAFDAGEVRGKLDAALRGRWPSATCRPA